MFQLGFFDFGSSGFCVDNVSRSVCFVYHEAHSAATPQPNFGMSRAKSRKGDIVRNGIVHHEGHEDHEGKRRN